MDLCTKFIFSRLQKYFEFFSPSPIHFARDLIIIPSTFICLISKGSFLLQKLYIVFVKALFKEFVIISVSDFAISFFL